MIQLEDKIQRQLLRAARNVAVFKNNFKQASYKSEGIHVTWSYVCREKMKKKCKKTLTDYAKAERD